MLEHSLQDFVAGAARKFITAPGLALQPPEAEARAWVWQNHHDALQRLLEANQGLGHGAVWPPRATLCRVLHRISKPVRDLSERCEHIRSSTHNTHDRQEGQVLTLACANPGRLGCADRNGNECYAPILDKDVGVNMAVQALGIDVVLIGFQCFLQKFIRFRLVFLCFLQKFIWFWLVLLGFPWDVCYLGGPPKPAIQLFPNVIEMRAAIKDFNFKMLREELKNLGLSKTGPK